MEYTYSEDVTYYVNNETKTISIEDREPLISGESKSHYVKINIDDKYVDGVDISQMDITVDWYNVKDGATGRSPVIDIVVDSGITFGWVIPPEAAVTPGELIFRVAARNDDKYVWKTLDAVKAIKSSKIDERVPSKPGRDIFDDIDDLKESIDSKLKAVQDMSDSILGTFVPGSVNLTPTGTVVGISPTSTGTAETTTKTSTTVKSLVIPVEHNSTITIEKTKGSRYYVAFSETDPSVPDAVLYRKANRHVNTAGYDINLKMSFDTGENNYLFFSFYSPTYDNASVEDILGSISIYYGTKWREDSYGGESVVNKVDRTRERAKQTVPVYIPKWYEGLEYTAVTLTDTCSVSEWYSKWDEFITNYPSKVKKNNLGAEQSGSYDIYEYVFNEGADQKILYLGGLHGSEKYAMRSDYLTIKYLLESGTGFVNNCEVRLIPMANPWGYSQTPNGNKFNSRGVNLNRNFPTSDWVASDISGTKGSEAETKIICKWIEDNSDAILLIHRHNTEPVSDGNNIAYSKSIYDTDRAMADAMYSYLNRVARNRNAWIDEYSGMVGRNIFLTKSYTQQGTLDFFASETYNIHAYLNESAATLGSGYVSTTEKRNSLVTIGMQQALNVIECYISNTKYAAIGSQTQTDIVGDGIANAIVMLLLNT